MQDLFPVPGRNSSDLLKRVLDDDFTPERALLTRAAGHAALSLALNARVDQAVSLLSFPRQGATPMVSARHDTAALAAAARRLLALRDQAGPLTAAAPPPVRSLADAIDRDLLIFRLEQAVQDLRAALSALEPGQPEG
jgi:hypothetical protein